MEKIAAFIKSKEQPAAAKDVVKSDDADNDVATAKAPLEDEQAKESPSSEDMSTAKESSSSEAADKGASEAPAVNQNKSESSESILMRRLLIVLTACFFTATAMTSFGFTSFKVMHGFYATMITAEGVNLLVRSLYVTYRIAWWQASRSSPVRESEAFQARLYRAKRFTDVLDHGFSAVQYALYLVIGTVINGKLIPLVFVGRLTHHLLQMGSSLYDHFTGRETSRFIN
ncbi:hypothetical protein COOONC_05857 [Cooperia oncophora]